MKSIRSNFLQETKRNIERNVDLSFEEMQNMDLCKIERHIKKER
jgi:hypothetical protein